MIRAIFLNFLALLASPRSGPKERFFLCILNYLEKLHRIKTSLSNQKTVDIRHISKRSYIRRCNASPIKSVLSFSSLRNCLCNSLRIFRSIGISRSNGSRRLIGYDINFFRNWGFFILNTKNRC